LWQVSACEHVFCKTCLIDFCASLGQASCPSCSKLLTVDLTRNVDDGDQASKTTIKGFRSSSILNRIQLDDFQTSTKIEALVCVCKNFKYWVLLFLPLSDCNLDNSIKALLNSIYFLTWFCYLVMSFFLYRYDREQIETFEGNCESHFLLCLFF
jgi:hypothetical protein